LGNLLTPKSFASRFSAYAACLLVLVSIAWSQSKPATPTLRVKIEATESDRQMLLDKLNARGADHHLKFALVDQDFNYRIEFGAGQGPYDTILEALNSSNAPTKVFDSQGTVLFELKREGRSTAGATNAAAKNIIKRLLQRER
jgi:hypothetical protein